MSWEDTRGVLPGAARRTAHADDTKGRTDESHHVSRPRPRGLRSLAPALVAGGVVLLLGGGATAAWVAGGDDPAPSPPSAGAGPTDEGAGPTEAEAPSASAPGVDPTTGLPLAPTDQDVTYAGVIRCVEAGDFLLSQCPSVRPETLACPAGLCTITFFVGPSLSSPAPGAAAATFRAGDPTVQFRGTDESGGCPGDLAIDGTRRPDGGYEIRIVQGARAGEFDGSCSPPSDNVFEITLNAPA